MKISTNLQTMDFIELHAKFNGCESIGRVLAMVEEANCKTIILENNPDEVEYKAEYDVFFKNVFSISDSAHIQRLHFFCEIIEDINEIVENDDRYLGYCDIRPLKNPSISCAILDKKIFVKENKNFLFLVCQRKFCVSFNKKINLSVTAFPYTQQDGRVIRCAQAALTSISKFFGNELTGPDFTKLTSQIPDGHRQIPSRGMTGEQIGISWEQLGKEPVLYDYMLDNYALDENKAELQHREQIIYRYLESGIPVLIGINAGNEMHALVVIGHTFTPDSWDAQTKTTYFNSPKTGFFYHCCTNWIERFVVQDDNLGPYSLILSDFLRYSGCKLITVGLPEGIFLMPEDAETFVGDLFSPQLHNIVETFDYLIAQHNVKDVEGEHLQHEETVKWYREFKKNTLRHELVLRTYLRTSQEWIDSIRYTKIFAEYKEFLEGTPLSKNVWVVEISWPYIFRHGRKLCGVVLIDPTDEITAKVNTLEQGWLWIHVPGLVMRRDVNTGDIESLVLEGIDHAETHHYTCE